LGGCGNRQAKKPNNQLVGEQSIELVSEQDGILYEEPFIPFHRRIFMGENQRKIDIDYASNKDLLNIVLLLPDSVSPIGWKFEDRKEWYNEVKLNNFWITSDIDHINQWCLKPNRICFVIMEGDWNISLYKTSDNSFIVISHEQIASSNLINIFEVKNNEIIEKLSFECLFGDYIEQLNINPSQECNEKFEKIEDSFIFEWFTFDFSDENIVEVSCSWPITKEKFENCLIGNSILYKFNPETKKFDIEKIYWKSNKIE